MIETYTVTVNVKKSINDDDIIFSKTSDALDESQYLKFLDKYRKVIIDWRPKALKEGYDLFLITRKNFKSESE